MDTKPTPRSNRAWGEIATQARSETPPEIDIRTIVRHRIESGSVRRSAHGSAPGTLDLIADWFTGIRVFATASAAVAALTVLGWQTFPVVRDVAVILEIERELFAGP